MGTPLNLNRRRHHDTPATRIPSFGQQNRVPNGDSVRISSIHEAFVIQFRTLPPPPLCPFSPCPHRLTPQQPITRLSMIYHPVMHHPPFHYPVIRDPPSATPTIIHHSAISNTGTPHHDVSTNKFDFPAKFIFPTIFSGLDPAIFPRRWSQSNKFTMTFRREVAGQ